MTAVTKLRSNLTLVTQDNEEDNEEEFERQPVEMGGFSDSFYLRPEEDDRVYFSAETASWLMKCELILECLMKNGVAHWEGYDEAIELFKEEWKK